MALGLGLNLLQIFSYPRVDPVKTLILPFMVESSELLHNDFSGLHDGFQDIS